MYGVLHVFQVLILLDEINNTLNSIFPGSNSKNYFEKDLILLDSRFCVHEWSCVSLVSQNVLWLDKIKKTWRFQTNLF